MQDLQPAPTSLKRADLIATIKGLIAEREAFVAANPGHEDVPAFRADIERKETLIALLAHPRVTTTDTGGHVHSAHDGRVAATWFRSEHHDRRFFIVTIGTGALQAVTDDFGNLCGVAK